MSEYVSASADLERTLHAVRAIHRGLVEAGKVGTQEDRTIGELRRKLSQSLGLLDWLIRHGTAESSSH